MSLPLYYEISEGWDTLKAKGLLSHHLHLVNTMSQSPKLVNPTASLLVWVVSSSDCSH